MKKYRGQVYLVTLSRAKFRSLQYEKRSRDRRKRTYASTIIKSRNSLNLEIAKMISAFFLIFLVSLTNASTLSSWGALRNFPSDEECLNYTVYPVQYSLIIYPHIFINSGSYYDCQLTVMVFANAPNINVIEMDAHDMDISHASVSFAGTEIGTRFKHSGGKLLIYLNQPLEYSLHKYLYQINITYRKYLRTDTEGIFVVPYNHDGTK